MINPTRESVVQAVYALESAGLYARGSDPLDWENAKRSGKPPQVIRGGTHTEKTPDFNVVHGSFMVTWHEDTNDYEVQGTNHAPTRFKDLTEASAHVVKYWKPVGEQQPLRRG